jgi:hypothetical protein
VNDETAQPHPSANVPREFGEVNRSPILSAFLRALHTYRRVNPPQVKIVPRHNIRVRWSPDELDAKSYSNAVKLDSIRRAHRHEFLDTGATASVLTPGGLARRSIFWPCGNVAVGLVRQAQRATKAALHTGERNQNSEGS